MSVDFSLTSVDLPGSNVRVNLSAREILKLADRIIVKSKKVHDAVASVPLDKVFTSLHWADDPVENARSNCESVCSGLHLSDGLQVDYGNVVSPLAELEAEQFPLVQSCVFPKLVSTSEEVRRASAEAERIINAHIASCRFFFCFLNLCSFCFWFHRYALPFIIIFLPSINIIFLEQSVNEKTCTVLSKLLHQGVNGRVLKPNIMSNVW